MQRFCGATTLKFPRELPLRPERLFDRG